MEDAENIPCISAIEPEFTIVNDRAVCTRTWQCSADPELSEGQTVKVGNTDCRVMGKVSGARFVTYKFSPSDGL